MRLPRRIRYTIVGEGPLFRQLCTLTRRLGVESIVELRGALDPTGVAEALAHADIFLLPSVSEVLPVALMEAQATGLPAVASVASVRTSRAR